MAEGAEDTQRTPGSPPSDRTATWDGLASVWTGWASTQISLLGVYLAAHAFIVAGATALLVEALGKESVLLGGICIAVCVLGCLVALAMRAAWARTVICTLFIEQELRRLEGNDGPFHRWQRVTDHNKRGEDLPLSLPSSALRDWWWFDRRTFVSRAKLFPPLLGLLYAGLVGVVCSAVFGVGRPAVAKPAPSMETTPSIQALPTAQRSISATTGDR